jgi:hypothetical protein
MREKSKLAVKHRDIGLETRAATAFSIFGGGILGVRTENLWLWSGVLCEREVVQAQ